MRQLFVCILLAIPLSRACAQAALAWPDVRQLVLRNHPAARFAETQNALARATLLRANGGFDPKAYADYENKNFAGKNYFRNTEAGIKLPTYLGLELKGAYLLADGDFLNPEHALPEDGQAVFGLNWTLGQGLLIDERRAGLQQARIGIRRAQAERSSLNNDLLLQAAKAYWTWTLADNQLRLYQAALVQARLRFDGLRESFRLGYKPAIDTVEAFIQVQNRSLDVNFGEIDLQNAALELGNLYWPTEQRPATASELGTAFLLQALRYPELPAASADELLRTAQSTHPELLAYTAKREDLEVERRLKNEKRKPVLDLNYNLLGQGWSFATAPDNSGGFGVLANNIKWGLQFSYPLLNRKARGDYQLALLKLAQTDLQISQKQQDIAVKVRQYTNDLNNLARQIKLYEGIVQNRTLLLEAENERFRLGSSSVFLIVTREQSLLDAQVKYLKLLSEYRKSEASLAWAVGNL
jgi:outer membrane protein TolC